MGAIYQLTFLVALGLLAIVVSVFVFAVSMLGRAMEAAAKAEKVKLSEIRTDNTREMASIRTEIETAQANGYIPRGLTKKLKKLEKKDRRFERELIRIRKAPELLTVRGGVAYTSVFLVMALVLTGASWYSSTIEGIYWAIPQALWILSLLSVGCGIYRIYKCLNAIQDVAVTSEEAWTTKMVDAFKLAQKQIEEERRPKLDVTIVDMEPPIRLKVDSEKTLWFRIQVTDGEFAEDISLYICLPPDFSFPDQETLTMPADTQYPGFICRKMEIARLNKGLQWRSPVTLKSPSKACTVNLIHFQFCRGFVGDKPTEVPIIVE